RNRRAARTKSGAVAATATSRRQTAATSSEGDTSHAIPNATSAVSADPGRPQVRNSRSCRSTPLNRHDDIAGRYDRHRQEDGTLKEQLEEIGAQLSWVRDYL